MARSKGIEVIQHNNARVEINHDTQIVTKHYFRKASEFYVRREAKWLRKLTRFDVAPKFIDYSGKTIVMKYVGKAVTPETLPDDWEAQLNNIADKLVKVKCFYLDLQLVHLRVLNGKIRLIDFGQTRTANPARKWIPELIRERMLNIVSPLVQNYIK